MLQTKTDSEADIFRKRCGQACRRRLQQATALKGNPVARDRGRQQKGHRTPTITRAQMLVPHPANTKSRRSAISPTCAPTGVFTIGWDALQTWPRSHGRSLSLPPYLSL